MPKYVMNILGIEILLHWNEELQNPFNRPNFFLDEEGNDVWVRAFGFFCSQCVPIKFQTYFQSSEHISQHVPHNASLCPIGFAQHCLLGTYIGG